MHIHAVLFPCPSLLLLSTIQPSPSPSPITDSEEITNQMESLTESQTLEEMNIGMSTSLSSEISNFSTQVTPASNDGSFPFLIVAMAGAVIVAIVLALLIITSVAIIVQRCRKKDNNFKVVHRNLVLNNEMYGKNGERIMIC